MSGTKKIILASTLVFILAAAVVVKILFFPAVKEEWFRLNVSELRQVPGGIVVVRPTHFSKSLHKGIIGTKVKESRWVVGRNVTLAQLMAVANEYNPARVTVPADAPTNGFDFLVTTSANPGERLRAAIHKETGYTAHRETRDADVLALKIVDARLPGLTVSADDEKSDVSLKDRKLNFKHMKLATITGGLEQMLKLPVVDKLGLTNFYDFSIPWNEQIQRQMQGGTMSREAVEKILSAWGIGLQPDTASMEMLVVEKAAN